MTESIELLIGDIQDDVLVDLNESISNDFAGVEQNLMNLHLDDEPLARIEYVQRFLNNIEGACQQTLIDPYIAYIHTVEDVLRATAEGKLLVCEQLSELLLLMIDQIRAACESLLHDRELDHELLIDLAQKLKHLCNRSNDLKAENIAELMKYFAIKVHPDLTFSASEANGDESRDKVSMTLVSKVKPAEQESAAQASRSYREVLKFPGNNEVAPIYFDLTSLASGQWEALESFKNLAESIEMRSRLWRHRSQKLLIGCLHINRNLPERLQVDEVQLRAAVYMHDTCMAVLPDSILFKKGKYESTDTMLLQQHPSQTYEMMRLMPGWREAADMVHQHHERYDGKGYPCGISGEEIHIGAQVIALGDAFFALTHKRADRAYHKSILRSVMELNNGKGTQFNPVVLEAFNKAAVVFLKKDKESRQQPPLEVVSG